MMKLYRAVIEDNNHPDKNGRVRVRVYGIHTSSNENSGEEFNFVSTNDLPWAEIMGSVEGSLNTGIGLSKIPKQGSLVWVIFDHDDINLPVVIGTINGISTKGSEGIYSGGEGFCDPEGIYPINERLNESDINRLARQEKLVDTIHQKIIDAKDDQSALPVDSISGADASQIEPDSLNDLSVYPNVSVMETASGHVVEFDDTPKDPLKPNDPSAQMNERIRVYHRTGSYIEIRPDGSFIQKSIADKDAEGADSINHYIHMSDVNEHIAKSVKRYIELNVDEIIGGYVKRNIIGTLDEHIVDAVTQVMDATLDQKITGAVTQIMEATLDQTITGAVTQTMNATLDQTVSAAVTQMFNSDQTITIGGNLSISTGGTIDIVGGGNITMTAPRVDIN